MLTLRAGDLAYYDSFAGMIPCKVLSIIGQSGNAGSSQSVRIRLTADRNDYKRGEVLESWGLYVCPRRAVKGNRIKAYQVEVQS